MTLTYDYTQHKYSAEEVFVAINGNKLILRDSGWLAGKSITITKLTKTELHITATDENSEENYEMIKR